MLKFSQNKQIKQQNNYSVQKTISSKTQAPSRVLQTILTNKKTTKTCSFLIN